MFKMFNNPSEWIQSFFLLVPGGIRCELRAGDNQEFVPTSLLPPT